MAKTRGDFTDLLVQKGLLSSDQLTQGGTGVLTVSGELDISTAGALQHALDELLDAGTERVEVDLSGVVFMDSSALSALVGAHERASKHNQRLALARQSPACARSRARSSALALSRVSSYSAAGFESITMPAPACT